MKVKDDGPPEPDRILVAGQPELERCDNQVRTSKYSLASFLPFAVVEQFRRVANLYFLIIGTIMGVGWYSPWYESAISPWTTLGPLVFVISISLLQEGAADLGRHRSDSNTNNHPCVVLRNASELDEEGGTRETELLNGKDVGVNLQKAYFITRSVPSGRTDCEVAFESVKRMNIRQGHIVLIRNRDMVPADCVLLASSADNGNAYIETSSIDGETNLKLRTSPHMPREVLDHMKLQSDRNIDNDNGNKKVILRETLEDATKRICRQSKLGFPNGISAFDNPSNPSNPDVANETEAPPSSNKGLHLMDKGKEVAKRAGGAVKGFSDNFNPSSRRMTGNREAEVKYVTALKTEPPNASVNTFNGVMMLPPIQLGGPSVEIPLNADNILLRGAILRNTEWAIGIACYTGTDTKLVRNSFETPSKFSKLDEIMNRTVLYILCLVALCIAYLATMSVYTNNKEFDNLWYIGYNKNIEDPWPFLPDLEPPKWRFKHYNWFQIYLLFITLLSNFVPLSLYVTIEVVTVVMRLLINLDINMYDAYTNTRTVARSTTVTDLGQVEYIFSDKTGTLTQNVMRFKRCSVDGLVFGAPITKATPDAEDEGPVSGFHPLNKLLVGKIPAVAIPTLPDRKPSERQPSDGLAQPGKVPSIVTSSPKILTFNGEMFLRVMSLCHTVVVEKDFDANHGIIKAAPTKGLDSQESGNMGMSLHKRVIALFSPKRDPPPMETNAFEEDIENDVAREGDAKRENVVGKGKTGAPVGFAYQAESPDEGALVEMSALQFNFQVIGRDSSGIKLSVESPTLFSDQQIVDGLKNGSLTEEDLAKDTASPEGKLGSGADPVDGNREEIWEVLAVNKFDSTRKRMSILVRSPPELGFIPMLLIKGADSAMLDPEILKSPHHAVTGDEDPMSISKKSLESADEDADFGHSAVLSLQSHLGEFAREGLRTLVLGVRILTEDECSSWLAEHTAAATSLKNRDEKLTAAATSIERKIHIVGATAIEDKLQHNVPATIAKLGEAGIKLWVLTGDKRETAKEIGYATKVLTEKMRPGLIEVPQGTKDEVRIKMAMTFLKLVKYAKLPEYQMSAIGENTSQRLETFLFRFGKFRRRLSRGVRRFYHKYLKICCFYFFTEVDPDDPALKAIDLEASAEKDILQLTERRRNVRNRAEKIVRDYFNTSEGIAHRNAARAKKGGNVEVPLEDLDLPSNEGPDVFHRADSARAMLQERRSQGGFSGPEIRDLSMVNLTAHGVALGDTESSFLDEDILSMKSFLPSDGQEEKKNFDKMKRTLLERLFAVDKATRHGRLVKHLNKDKLHTIQEEGPIAIQEPTQDTGSTLDGPRGLVIEGAALEKLLGDSELEELLFAVANTCDSVIACRVSPAQKAQLVQLVRRYVVPEPVTLAIGDGANDVGMIQEAHVGVGISGKEGQQAVNASDFAIAQFRFLQDLTLIHGRWNFMRLSAVVLFSFYKNAVMAGCLIAFTGQSVYSGTPLFDEWLIAMLNFVAGIPIMALGIFDRCLDREYVLKNPTTYTPTRRNELIKKRVLLRWVLLVLLHIFTIYFFSVYSLAAQGAGATSAFVGLMGNEDPDRPGEGEGGDLKSLGFVSFSSLVILLVYKVLFESRSIIIGRWPAFQCKKDGEGWVNRLSYTWIANAYGSIGFYLFGVYTYQSLGRSGPSAYSLFVNTVNHALNTRVRSWMLLIFVPIAAMIFDVATKVCGNLFFPTQTQIHMEIFTGRGKREKRVENVSLSGIQDAESPEVVSDPSYET